jgi:hypothetical protein
MSSPPHEGDTARIRGVVRAAGRTLRSQLHDVPCVYWDVRVGLADEPEATDVCAFWVEDEGGERFLVRVDALDVDVRAQRAESLVQLVEEDIAAVSATIRQLKETAKHGPVAQQAEANRERRRLAKVATLLCAVRAEARGNVHVGGNLAGQRAWIAAHVQIATNEAGRSLQRRVERFEVVLREGDAVEVEGVVRREPLPSSLGGGYRERTDCWAMVPGPSGHVRVVGVGESAPVPEADLRPKEPAGTGPVLPRAWPKMDPVLLWVIVVSALLTALALSVD